MAYLIKNQSVTVLYEARDWVFFLEHLLRIYVCFIENNLEREEIP